VRRMTQKILMAAMLLSIATCSSLDDIEVETRGTTRIPRGTVLDELLGQLSFAGFDGLDISQSQELRNQGYSKRDIDSVHIVSFTLTITDPEGGSFDFLRRIAFSVEAEDLPSLEIARLDPIPGGQSVIELQVDSSVDLTPYVVAPAMKITTQATGTRPAQETTVEALVVFAVDINLTGRCF
jgi:hypothetical protein